MRKKYKGKEETEENRSWEGGWVENRGWEGGPGRKQGLGGPGRKKGLGGGAK